MKEVFISIIVLAYIAFSGYYSFTLYKTDQLSSSRKLFHILMVWLLPFIWIVLIREMLFKRTDGSYEVKIKNDVSSNQFHESGKGFPW
jgi:hypothetical protein